LCQTRLRYSSKVDKCRTLPGGGGAPGVPYGSCIPGKGIRRQGPVEQAWHVTGWSQGGHRGVTGGSQGGHRGITGSREGPAEQEQVWHISGRSLAWHIRLGTSGLARHREVTGRSMAWHIRFGTSGLARYREVPGRSQAWHVGLARRLGTSLGGHRLQGWSHCTHSTCIIKRGSGRTRWMTRGA